MTQPAPTPTAPPPGDPAPTPTDPTPTPAPSPPTSAPGPTPADSGQSSLKADLAKEREKRKQLEAIIAQSLGIELKGGGQGATSHADQIAAQLSSHEERFAQYEKDLADERAARWRVEIAATKGLTPDQAAWLQGSTQEELVASADRLLAAFPTVPPGPRTPAPDPSQGARGGQPGPDLQAQIDEARKAGDVRKAIALERSKLLSIPRPN